MYKWSLKLSPDYRLWILLYIRWCRNDYERLKRLGEVDIIGEESATKHVLSDLKKSIFRRWPVKKTIVIASFALVAVLAVCGTFWALRNTSSSAPPAPAAAATPQPTKEVTPVAPTQKPAAAQATPSPTAAPVPTPVEAYCRHLRA